MGRNNSEFVVLVPEVATALTRTSAQILNPHNRGIILMVSIKNGASTPSFTPEITIQHADGSYHDIWVAAAALTANDEYAYYLHPGAIAGAGSFTEVDAIVIPISYKVVLTRNTGNADTIIRAYSLV
ncbi:MAG: hypothetical protein KAJ19_09960 [Gammaproteobacteria bacterium]|nr:hypothetical protein [Gammaproteobacteria bacterium]